MVLLVCPILSSLSFTGCLLYQVHHIYQVVWPIWSLLPVTVSGESCGALALTHSPLSSLTSLLQMQTLLLLRSILWYRAPYSADHFNSLSLIFLPKELQVSEIDDKQVLLECEQTANRWLLLENDILKFVCCLRFFSLHFVCLLLRLFAFCLFAFAFVCILLTTSLHSLYFPLETTLVYFKIKSKLLLSHYFFYQNTPVMDPLTLAAHQFVHF